MVGSRAHDIQDRFFRGDVYELVVYNRTLTASELERVQSYLQDRWGLPNPSPNCTLALNCTLPPATAATVQVAACLDRALTANATLTDTFVHLRASYIVQYAAAFQTRCDGQKSGQLPLLPTLGSTLAALRSYGATIDQMWLGLQQLAASYEQSSAADQRAVFLLWTACGGSHIAEI